MPSRRALVLPLLLLLASGSALAQDSEAPPPASPKRVYFGGGVGLAFGDVEYILIQPLLGFQVTPRVLVGGSLIYRYTNDDRYADSVSSTDYGASGFARYGIHKGFFVQGEYEYLSYEFPVVGGGTSREGYDSILVGPGFSAPMGHAGFYAAALYNVSYDNDDLNAPYDDPWVIRIGFGFAF